jgi:hypothetical protein
MKIVIFMAILIVGVLLIPDSLVGHFIRVPGDGESAMDKYDFILVLIKAAISAVVAIALMQILRRAR